jgi:hypothetical protein
MVLVVYLERQNYYERLRSICQCVCRDVDPFNKSPVPADQLVLSFRYQLHARVIFLIIEHVRT